MGLYITRSNTLQNE